MLLSRNALPGIGFFPVKLVARERNTDRRQLGGQRLSVESLRSGKVRRLRGHTFGLQLFDISQQVGLLGRVKRRNLGNDSFGVSHGQFSEA